MYAVKTDVGIIPRFHPASGVPQGGAEGPFLFLLVILSLAIYIRRTYPDVSPYPLRTTLLAFADDMAVVTATASQPLSPSPGHRQGHQRTPRCHQLPGGQPATGAQRQIRHHGTQRTIPATPPRRPAHEPSTATYMRVQQASDASGVTLPPNLIRQLTRTLVTARIVATSTQALAYFLPAVLNAAIGFGALHLTQPQQMLQAATTTVRQALTIRPTSLPAAVHAAPPPY